MIKHSLNAKLPEQLAQRLEKAILAQEYRAGERLPAERAWAQTLGVSRAALREALGALAERGLVQRRHGAGTYVSERPDERRADPWKQMLQRQPLLQADLLEFREMLEIRCAGLAARRARAEDITRLGERLATVDAAYLGHDRQAQVFADVAFHRAIAEATRNPVFSQLVASLLEWLHEHVMLSIAEMLPDSTDSRQLRRQHQALYNCIAAHDEAGAARIARNHIHFVWRSWRQRIGQVGAVAPDGAQGRAASSPQLERVTKPV